MFLIQNLKHAYNATGVLSAAWQADQGVQSLVIGPSGSGKATVPHVLAAILHPTAGSVSVASAHKDGG